MSTKDYRRRETKKPKKELKQLTSMPTIVTPAAMVEVIKTKGKKEKGAAEETEE